MNLSTFALNLRGPWMIHPEQAAVMLPILKGIMAGYDVEVPDVREDTRLLAVDGMNYVEPDYTGKVISVVRLAGTMMKYDNCGMKGTVTVAREMLAAEANPNVVGHIIIAESGGGAGNSVPEIADAIRQLEKPVVAWIDGIAASACIYADGSEDKNADYEAALEGNAKLIKDSYLNPLNQEFVETMKRNRPGCTPEQLTGKTYFAGDVVGSFIDAVGPFADAVGKVLELAGIASDGNRADEPQEDNGEINSSTMENKYKNLSSIPELQEQVYAEDGSTTLQKSQLEAIEAALSAPRAEENDLRAHIDTLNADHRAQVDGLNGTIAEREAQIAQRDARISELQTALDEAVARNEQEQPAEVEVDADPSNSSEGDAAPARNFREAAAVCREFLNRNNQ